MHLSLIASCVVIIDRLTKYFFCSNLSHGRSIKVIPGIFHLTLVFNTGSAFGLFKDWTRFFIMTSIIVIALILFYCLRYRYKDILLITSLGLILGGAIGNLIDRILFGYVIDFLDFRVWPVFNIADSSISIGAALLALKALFDKRCFTI
ncbi:MAG: signal peptidase II [Omnitrophica bacterium RIFCSPLOWO2_02_FULL_45_16]|nr:MAG: signal peptidase II [Omnitrophica bacterium RIFCSPHIGHO2_02_FULL_46_20]OGW93158.1 MAG: signal peptidase II [Omnitrophica bacterium RIFCSPLOWO2_12_FULL_45_13]OGW94470.1 MAG: signal peptidase II [Omnitrophica bacterium RIFCSPLOWO2_01_FULL_45_24]OGX00385.1 MAG: signal peptidase II [Omnitrophica bacterium RIFCSPLOWO2_02_FULL_45_16]